MNRLSFRRGGRSYSVNPEHLHQHIRNLQSLIKPIVFGNLCQSDHVLQLLPDHDDFIVLEFYHKPVLQEEGIGRIVCGNIIVQCFDPVVLCRLAKQTYAYGSKSSIPVLCRHDHITDVDLS